MDIMILDKPFRPIPGFDGYHISKDADVYSPFSRKILTPQKGTNGYLEYSLKRNGFFQRVGQHRLMGLTYLDKIDTPEKLVINHKNGRKHQNRVDNLEWATYKQNQEHAGRMGLTEKCKPISSVSWPSLHVTHYPSYVECARVLGLTRDMVSWRAKTEGRVLFPEGNLYVDTSKLEGFLCKIREDSFVPEDSGSSKAVMMKNVLTNEEMCFSKISDLASYLKMSPSTLTAWFKIPGQPLFPGFIQIKYCADPSTWRPVGDVYLEIARSRLGTRPVVVLKPDGSRDIHMSAVDCAKAVGINPTALSYRLQSRGNVVFSDKNRYVYYDEMCNGPVNP